MEPIPNSTDTTADGQPAAPDAASPVLLLATDGPLRPAITLGPAYPANVSGLPAFYYWKDAIRTGTYAHPAGRYSLSVTRERLDGYARTFATMRANGVGVRIPRCQSCSADSATAHPIAFAAVLRGRN